MVTSPARITPVPGPGLPPQLMWMVTVPANLLGATATYLYFTYVDPLGGPVVGHLADLALFVAVVGVLVCTSWVLTRRFLRPLIHWRARLLAGEDPARVPVPVRRAALNAAIRQAVQTLAMWSAAGVIYLGLTRTTEDGTWVESFRVGLGIVLAGGLPTSAITFLLAEYHWRRRIPEFFPDGRLERRGVVRIPIRIRLAATFLLTSIVPLLVLLTVALALTVRLDTDVPERVRVLWQRYVEAELYIVLVTVIASTVMALLVARFVNRPIQALRWAMARVEEGDFDARVRVRSTDELGELIARFNRMVVELRRAAETRLLFGRYVSPEVARRALERGVELGGEVVTATAMFADLRGFTARSERLPVEDVVSLLATYYEIVETVCQHEQGIITQFMGDGVVAVFGSPLLPADDHAARATRAARAIQRRLSETDAPDGEPLDAGVGICTGDMIAGNVGAGERLIYTIVGDAVNQAARLQVQTRELDASILLTDSTRDALPPEEATRLRFLGRVALRGVASEVGVWAADA